MEFDEYESLPTADVGVHMTAGAVAGIMEHCVMFPIDSVKVSLAACPGTLPGVRGYPADRYAGLGTAGGAGKGQVSS